MEGIQKDVEMKKQDFFVPMDAEDVLVDCQWMQHVRKGGVAVFDDWIEQVEKAVMEYVSIHPDWEMLTSSTAQAPKHPWKTVFWRN